jgi:hypothetical protein
MNLIKSTLSLFCLTAILMLAAVTGSAQVTTSSATGTVKDSKGEELIGATILAVHTPSGSTYGTITNEDGRFNISNLRVGGPYKFTVSYIGYKTYEMEIGALKLGESTKFNLVLAEDAMALEAVEIVYKKNALINNARTGAGTSISNAVLNSLPTLGRNLTEATKLTPQAKGFSFAGIDSRMNNFTIDGSVFNNNFGLQELPGSQTNSSPISLDAIEEININIAPFDVRQGGFAGAGVNAVTRSGSNTITGSAFFNTRTDAFTGDSISYKNSAGEKKKLGVSKAGFDVKQVGFRLGGPIIKDKLFYFINAEAELRTDPGNTFTSNNGDGKDIANETRVTKTQLDSAVLILKDKFNYNPGVYDDITLGTKSYKALVRFDYNISQKHKASFRFNYLRSFRDVAPSNSGTFDGGRSGNKNSLYFSNSAYTINNDIYSGVFELNSMINDHVSNKFIAGYTANRDYRSSNSAAFPLVDILKDGTNYMSFGYEAFTPNNTLNTDTWQISDQLNIYKGKHNISLGFNAEYFNFLNIFTPNYYGQYIFKNFEDFKRAANGGTGIELQRYNLNYSAVAGGGPWEARTKVINAGAYIQDEFDATDYLRITAGVRVDVPYFGLTEPLRNTDVETLLNFKDGVQVNTSTLPKTNVNVSPRIGFNWDVLKNKQLQLRGGTGLFAGRPPFVWISNSVGNNGVLSGSISQSNTKNFPFSPDVKKYIPTNVVVGQPTPTYEVAPIDPNLRFPQVWRSSLAFDKKLPMDMVLTVEGIYGRTLVDVGYLNLNQRDPVEGYREGPDKRSKYATNAIYSKVTSAAYMTNTSQSNMYAFTASLEKQFSKGWYAKLAYNYSQAFDLQSAGSIANNSWRDALSTNGNNFLELGHSNNELRNRVIGAVSYAHDWGKISTTRITIFGEARNQGNYSFAIAGDANFDGQSGNDLMFIPEKATDLKFADIVDKDNKVLFTVTQQQEAFQKMLDGNDYLKANKGKYAQRNGALLPFVYNFDVSLVQEFHVNIAGKRNTFQLRGDIFNLGNLLNNAWGTGYFITNYDSNRRAARVLRMALDKEVATGAKLITKVTDAQPTYQYIPVAGKIDYDFTSRSANLGDTWQAQIGLRYTF